MDTYKKYEAPRWFVVLIVSLVVCGCIKCVAEWVLHCMDQQLCFNAGLPPKEIHSTSEMRETVADLGLAEVYVIYYYRPGCGEQAQKDTLKALDFHFGHVLPFVSVDVSKHKPPVWDDPDANDRLQTVPYLVLVRAERVNSTWQIASFDREFIPAPASFAVLRDKIQRFVDISRQRRSLGVGLGRRAVPGWDYDKGAFITCHQEAVIARITTDRDGRVPTLYLRFEGDERRFVADLESCADLQKLKVGDKVYFSYRWYDPADVPKTIGLKQIGLSRD